MAEVDPFVVDLTPESITNRDTLEYLNRFLHDLWIRTGGGDDAVSSIENGELYEPGIQLFDADELDSELDDFAPDYVHPPIEVVSTSANYQTTGDQIVVCTNTSDITVTLNPNPDDGEQVHIKRQNTGLVTVSGTVDGLATTDIVFRYDSPHLVYTLDAGEWSLV